MSYLSRDSIAAEFARSAKQFHKDEDPMSIELWGLFLWGQVSRFIKTGEITTTMLKINRRIWCRPSQEFYDKHIKPLMGLSIRELSLKAGWGPITNQWTFPDESRKEQHV
jgi:hypothetical protein